MSWSAVVVRIVAGAGSTSCRVPESPVAVVVIPSAVACLVCLLPFD